MCTIRYIHWNKQEAAETAKQIQALGHEVSFQMPPGGQFIKEVDAKRPDLIIINLSRLPSQGRDFAFMIRARKSTRCIPIIFLEGQADKVASIKNQLPDAIYTTWDSLANDIELALTKSISNPVTPDSMMDAYKGKSLAEKLGIKDRDLVALINPPNNYPEIIEPKYNNVIFIKQPVPHCNLLIWFVQDSEELIQHIHNLLKNTDCGKIWIAWPKKSSSRHSDLTQTVVRKTGLEAGLIDYKISSFDEIWSGLLFARRKK